MTRMTSLLKNRDEVMEKKYRHIPKDLKTPLEDLAIGVKEINARAGDAVFMVVGEKDHDVVSIGANCISDIAFYANYFDIFDGGLPEDIAVLKVRVEDPENLPYEVSDYEFVYVIYDDWHLKMYGSMKEAADFIENSFTVHTEAEIHMFSVLIGRELPKGVKRKFIEKYEEIRKEHTWSGNTST